MKHKGFRSILLLLILLLILASCSKSVMATPTTKKDDTQHEQHSENNGDINTDSDDEKIQNNSEQSSEVHPLLWEVSAKKGDGKVYLFGSIHVADESIYPLPDAVMSAFNESSSLAVEFDITEFGNDINQQIEMLNSMLLPNGENARDIMGDELYEKVKSFLINNGAVFYDAYNSYNMYFWSSLVDEVLLMKSDLKTENGVDNHFLLLAHDSGKEILNIESMEFQMDILNSTPDELQLYMIEQTIDEQDSYNDDLNALYNAYISGNEEELIKYALVDMSELENEVLDDYEKIIVSQLKDYNDAMVYDRNKNMAKAAIKYMESGKNVFLVVGAAHMIGEGGIVSLLRQAGYTVNEVNY